MEKGRKDMTWKKDLEVVNTDHQEAESYLRCITFNYADGGGDEVDPKLVEKWEKDPLGHLRSAFELLFDPISDDEDTQRRVRVAQSMVGILRKEALDSEIAVSE